jgi:hypothetical protein
MLLLLKKRKAQITVFIIIGVILIFSFGIYSYVKSQGITPAKIEVPKSPPVVAFVEACLERTAETAIRAMGDQGGYISLPPDLALDLTKHVALIPGIGGEFSPKVPYWYFEGQSQIPSLRYMEIETENYINDNLKFCLENFTGLRQEFDITEKSNYSTDVLFGDKTAIVTLNYKIDIQPKGSAEVMKREQFIVNMDASVKRMWELSKELLEAENTRTFFENMTINLMASHPPQDIPFTGMTLECGRKTWLLSSVKKKLITALEPAVIGIRYKNTDHPPFVANDDAYRAVHNAVSDWSNSQVNKKLVLPKNIPSDSYSYFQYYFDFTNKSYKDLKVVSLYKKQWGMNLLATPNQYGVMKSGVQDLKSKILSYLCLNTYHFVYDLTYPVMVSVEDPKAFHDTGFVFRFAFPVQIFHNNPDRSILPTRLVEPTEYPGDYCSYYGTEDYTIIAKDVVTGAELSKVNLTFTCLRESCILGSTRTNNLHLQWKGKFPAGCSGALITANRSGYLLKEVQYDGSEPFYIDMIPTQPVRFDIKRHTETEPGVARFLDPDMFAIIQLESRNPEFSVFEIFGDKDTFNREEVFELPRVSTTYDLNIMLVKKMGKDEDRMVGGWTGNWTVGLNEMLDARKVVFHVMQKFPTPKTDEEMVTVYEMMSNHSKYPEVVPQIIRADEYTGEAQ